MNCDLFCFDISFLSRSETVNISTDAATALLRHFAWNRERLFDQVRISLIAWTGVYLLEIPSIGTVRSRVEFFR